MRRIYNLIVLVISLFCCLNLFAYDDAHSNHAYHKHKISGSFHLDVIDESASKTTYAINFGHSLENIVLDEIYLKLEFDHHILASENLFLSIKNICNETLFEKTLSDFRTKTDNNFLILSYGFVDTDNETIFRYGQSQCLQFSVMGKDPLVQAEIYLTYHVPSKKGMAGLYYPDPYISYGIAGSISDSNTELGANTLHYLEQQALISDYSCTSIWKGKKIPKGTKKLIILIHGWNPNAKKNHFAKSGCEYVSNEEIDNDVRNLSTSWYQLYRKLGTQPPIVTDDWIVARYDWSKDASTGELFREGCLSCSANAARDAAFVNGKKLGKIIASLNLASELKTDEKLQIQFIAHSAGNWVARRAADYLEQKYQDKVLLQVTSLDAFVNDRDIVLFGDDIDLKPNFTLMADWVDRTDNYFVYDFNTDLFYWTSGILQGWNKNVDIEIEQGKTSYLYKHYMKHHTGPVNWYARTADKWNQFYHAISKNKQGFGYSQAYHWKTKRPEVVKKSYSETVSTNIDIFFSEFMDSDTFISDSGFCKNISIQGSKSYIAKCSYNAIAKMLTIDPVYDFDIHEKIKIELDPLIKDLFGNNLKQDNFTISDTGFPEITVPAKVLIPAKNANGTPKNNISILKYLNAAKAIDEYDGAVIVKNNAPDVLPIGINTISFFATDTAGNTSTKTSVIEIKDITPPSINFTANQLVIELESGGVVNTSDAEIKAFLSSAKAVDNLDGWVKVFHDAPNNFALGLTLVTFSATDTAGNRGITQGYVIILSRDNDADGIPNDYEIEHGLDPNDADDAIADLDGDGLTNIDEYNQGTHINFDDVAPILTIPDDIETQSIGPLTPVDLGMATAIDAKDGIIIPKVDNLGPFQAGRNEITWSAADKSGNSVTAKQIVDVIPKASLSVSQTLTQGDKGTIDIVLNGRAVSYPVKVPFRVTGSAIYGRDHNLTDGNFIIESGIRDSIDFSSFKNEKPKGNKNIQITIDKPINAIKGGLISHNIILSSEKLTPKFTLNAHQNDSLVTTIAKDAGVVTITAEVNNKHMSDGYSYDWSLTSNAIISIAENKANKLIFDPEKLPEGMHKINVKVAKHSNSQTFAQSLLKLISNMPTFTNTDTDKDGFNDITEGMSDINKNRIPDYLDISNQDNHLPIGNKQTMILSDVGIQLMLGDIAFMVNKNTPMISISDLLKYGVGEKGFIEDDKYEHSTGIVDLIGKDMVKGESLRVVIPQLEPIMSYGVYRNYIDSNGWGDFVQNSENTIMSALGEQGICPDVGDLSYRKGVSEGHQCIQLTIKDGGLNDGDGVANGVVKHIGGMASALYSISH